MNKLSRIIIAWMIIVSCKNKAVNYENSLGIKPSVIAQIDTPHYTTIEWKDTVKNFGRVREGDSVIVQFSFTNSGRYPLFLTEVSPSCGCTVANYPQGLIEPGKGGQLTAVFNSNYHPGFIHKTIVVTSNTSNKIKQVLSFTGQVQAKDSARVR